MPQAAVKRLLFLVNRSSGAGYDPEYVKHLFTILKNQFPAEYPAELQPVDSHPEAKSVSQSYLASSDEPAAILIGGGGGTTRSVVEAIFSSKLLSAKQQVCIAVLRMGSGNLLAKLFGVQKKPEEALRGILGNLLAGVTAPCCVIQCEAGTASGSAVKHYGVAMAGFGQFGRIPGVLARWHRKAGPIRRRLASIIGLENLNNFEYAAALFLCMVGCSLSPGRMETITVEATESKQIKVLSGVLLNFPFSQIPVDPGVKAGEEALAIYLIPFHRRRDPLALIFASKQFLQKSWKIRLERNDEVTFRCSNAKPVEFFLDEDPEYFVSYLKMRIAGTVKVVPGSLFHRDLEKTLHRGDAE